MRPNGRVTGWWLMRTRLIAAGVAAALVLGADMDRQREIASSAAYKEGDPEAVTARYRLHFMHALARPEAMSGRCSQGARRLLSADNAGLAVGKAVN